MLPLIQRDAFGGRVSFSSFAFRQFGASCIGPSPSDNHTSQKQLSAILQKKRGLTRGEYISDEAAHFAENVQVHKLVKLVDNHLLRRQILAGADDGDGRRLGAGIGIPNRRYRP